MLKARRNSVLKEDMGRSLLVVRISVIKQAFHMHICIHSLILMDVLD